MEKVDLGSDGKAINKSTAKSSNLMMSWLKPKIKSENKGMRNLPHTQISFILTHVYLFKS